jgi:hypothetical protein
MDGHIQRILTYSPDTIRTFFDKDTFDHKDDNEYLHINRCTMIKLPLWTDVKYLMIYNCVQLIDLPCWSQMIEIWIMGCPGLKKLPSWSNVENINIDNHVIKLGYWPKIRNINCYFCCYVSSAYYYKSLKRFSVYSYEILSQMIDVPQEFVVPTIKSNFFSKIELEDYIRPLIHEKSYYHQKMKKIIIINAWLKNPYRNRKPMRLLSTVGKNIYNMYRRSNSICLQKK